MTAQLSGRILEVATNMGADAIVVACPLCQMNLDLRQKQAMKGVDRYFNMPVLYYTQMMGLAFGMLPSELGLDKLVVSANALVERISKEIKHENRRFHLSLRQQYRRHR